MKHTTRKLLSLVLSLTVIVSLLTSAFAANTDVLSITGYPAEGSAFVDVDNGTTFWVDADVNNAAGREINEDYYFTYSWTLNGKDVSSTHYYVFPKGMSAASYTLVCSVTATHKTDRTVLTKQLIWYPVFQQKSEIQMTISQGIGTYSFTDRSGNSGTSIQDEIVTALGLRNTNELKNYTFILSPGFSQIATCNGPLTCTLDKLNEISLTLEGSGTWVGYYTVNKGNVVVLSDRISITIEPALDLDAAYYALPGQNVVISADDILAFWKDAAGRYASLDYVYITSCPGVNGVSGTLCYDHSATELSHTSSYNVVMYVNPSTQFQNPLEDLTFVPSSVGGKYPSGTATVSFTAIGTNNKKETVVIDGTFVIFYTDKAPDAIVYDCTGSFVYLNGDDFDDVYRAVTDTNTRYPSYNIRFLDVPTYGVLYRVSSDEGYNGVTDIPLNSENLASMIFSSTSTGINSLDKLVYVPASYIPGGETIRYVAYSGSTILYTGTVVLRARELEITYTASNGAIRFSSGDFFTANGPLQNAPFLMFGAPSSGTLYKDYANGVRVQSSDYFSYNNTYGVNLLDNVTYVPQEGFAGLVEIPFIAQAITGGVINGKVCIYVVRDFFSDVDPNSWAAPYINRLYATGVINGTSATTFSPSDNMTYGAALKMILLAAGYPKQSETGGTHWASNYLTLAYYNGIVSSTNIDLNAAVDRDTIAEIAAKALGLSKALSVNAGITPPSDSTNGYVYALYNAGILNGSFVDGYNYFYGSNYITRAEVAKIICMISDYAK